MGGLKGVALSYKAKIYKNSILLHKTHLKAKNMLKNIVKIGIIKNKGEPVTKNRGDYGKY